MQVRQYAQLQVLPGKLLTASAKPERGEIVEERLCARPAEHDDEDADAIVVSKATEVGDVLNREVSSNDSHYTEQCADRLGDDGKVACFFD